MSHIFISYSKRNKTYARQLADFLIESGFEVWIDDRIDYGSLWVDVIQKAIEECSAFVVIMTPEARESQWVQTECEYAAKKGKPVFPLLLGGEPFFRYVSVQYADVSDGSLPLDSFLDELAEHAQRRTGQGADVTAPEACEVKRPNAVPRTKPARRSRMRLPLLVAAGIPVALMLVALAFALQDDSKDEPTQEELAQIQNPTPEPTLQAANPPHSGDCRFDWFFGNEYAMPGDCPTSEPTQLDGVIQTFGEGVLIGLDASTGRYFVLGNNGQYFDRTGNWDAAPESFGDCVLPTIRGFYELVTYNDAPAEYIGCPLEPAQAQLLSYQTSDASSEYVVYVGMPDSSEAYRLAAPNSRPETDEGVWQRVR